MKNALKIICFIGFLSACSDWIKNNNASTEGTKPHDYVIDSTGCSAIVSKELVLNDSNLRLPKIITGDNNIAEKINRYLTLENIAGYTHEDVRQQKEAYKKDSLTGGLSDVGFGITYNENCLLSMAFSIGTCGAYPSYSSAYYNFDLSTGDSIGIEKLLNERKINELIFTCDKVLQKRITETKKQYPDDKFILDQLEDRKFTRAELASFFVTATDIVFVYPFSFPHAIQSAQPDDLIKISREEFRKYLKENPYRL